jgi:hypothetical protein
MRHKRDVSQARAAEKPVFMGFFELEVKKTA